MDDESDDEKDPIFGDYESEFLEFDNVKDKKSVRPDVHAFLLLDEIVPPKPDEDMICSAEHDQIWLQTDVETLKATATPDQLRDLHRCGVFYEEDTDSLTMFV